MALNETGIYEPSTSEMFEKVGVNTYPDHYLTVVGENGETRLAKIAGEFSSLFVDDTESENIILLNNRAGLPLVQVKSSNKLLIGEYDQNDLVISNNKVGFGTANPTEKVHIEGNLRVNGFIIDSAGSTGQSGYILIQTDSGILWSSGSISGGGGGVIVTGLTSGAIPVMGATSLEDSIISQSGAEVTVSGGLHVSGPFRDSLNSFGTSGYILQSLGSGGTEWVQLLTGGAPYSQMFDASGDWSGPTSGYYYIDFNHNLGSRDLLVNVWEKIGTSYAETWPSSTLSTTDNTVRITVSDSPDYRFEGLIVIANEAGVGGGGSNLPLDATGYLKNDGAGNLSWESIITSAGNAVKNPVTQTSHGFTAGNVVRINGGVYEKAIANDPEKAEVVGIVDSVINSNQFSLLTHGYITSLSGLVSGETYFLSSTVSGQLTSGEPTGLTDISKPLFIADSTSGGYFNNWRGAYVGNANGGIDLNADYTWSGVHSFRFPIQQRISTISYSSGLVIDFGGSPIQLVTLTGDTSISTSNRSDGEYSRQLFVKIAASGASRGLSFDSNIHFVSSKPTGIVTGKVGILSLTSVGPSESDTIAAYAVEG